MEMQKLYTVLWLQSCVLKIKLLKTEKVLYTRTSYEGKLASFLWELLWGLQILTSYSEKLCIQELLIQERQYTYLFIRF
jgi:hypothetical protein